MSNEMEIEIQGNDEFEDIEFGVVSNRSRDRDRDRDKDGCESGATIDSCSGDNAFDF